MRFPGAAAVSLGLYLGALAACSLLTETDGFDNGTPQSDGGNDGPANGDSSATTPPPPQGSDGGSVVDAGADADSGPMLGPNLATNAGFELGCGGWTNEESVSTSLSLPRTGSKSCKVCTLGNQAFHDTSIFQAIAVPDAGTTVVVEAWIKNAPSASAQNPVEIFVSTGGIPQTSGSVAATGDWQSVQAIYVTNGSEESIDIAIGREGDFDAFPDDLCFLVDDVTFNIAAP